MAISGRHSWSVWKVCVELAVCVPQQATPSLAHYLLVFKLNKETVDDPATTGGVVLPQQLRLGVDQRQQQQHYSTTFHESITSVSMASSSPLPPPNSTAFPACPPRASVAELAAKKNRRGSATICTEGRSERSKRSKDVWSKLMDTCLVDVGEMDKILCDLLLPVRLPEVYRHIRLLPPRAQETQNAPVNPSPPQLINPALSEEPQLNPAAPPGDSQLKIPVTSPPRDLTQPMSVQSMGNPR
ncbi:hypothetical protein pipiens_018862 [Culex pipiens pipiens]|uniref:Uncharacterized protein n=1 Tax=Culex pipiens pipiens TaxID=38569 RepID=A0ABD1DXM8_CULPP